MTDAYRKTGSALVLLHSITVPTSIFPSWKRPHAPSPSTATGLLGFPGLCLPGLGSELRQQVATVLNQIGVDLDREKKSSDLGCWKTSIIRTAIGWQSEQVSDPISPMRIIGYVLAWPVTATLAKVQRQAIKNGAAFRKTRRQSCFRDTQISKILGSILSNLYVVLSLGA